MAKGNPNGTWTGKVGSQIYYKIWNTNNKVSQGIRVYQPVTRNPQTDLQAQQRMRLLPAQRIAGALKAIVSRSFQGVSYGPKSRLAFRTYALRLAEGYPFVPKGETRPIPGTYLVSKGTLPQISTTVASTDTHFSGLNLGVYTSEQAADFTVGNVSARIIANNPGFAEGDQLTFVVCGTDATGVGDSLGSEYYWDWKSFVLNTQDPTPWQSSPIGSGVGLIASVESPTNSTLSIGYELGQGDSTEPLLVAASAVIHSRLGDDGQYLRSDAVLTVPTDGFMSPWFTDTQMQQTRGTYQASTTRSADWPTEPGGTASGFVESVYTIAGLTGDIAAFNGAQVKVARNADTNELIGVYSGTFTGETGFCVDENRQVITRVLSDQSEIGLPIASVTALAGLPRLVV